MLEKSPVLLIYTTRVNPVMKLYANIDTTAERRLFVYCAHKCRDGKYILLDRFYKPVGWIGDVWADYEAWPRRFAVQITPQMAAKMSYKGSDDVDRIWFFNDSCPPWRDDKNRKAYLKRLELFFD